MGGRARYAGLLGDAEVRCRFENVARGSEVAADVYLRRLGSFCQHFGLRPKQLVEKGEDELYGLPAPPWR